MSNNLEPRDVSRLSGSMESSGRLLRTAARRAFVASASCLNSPQARSAGADDPASHGGRSDADIPATLSGRLESLPGRRSPKAHSATAGPW
jgi:hypothetical protein